MTATDRQGPAQQGGGGRREEQQPAAREVTEVAPGILRMQLPISMPGLGHVNCYALEDERGFTVVDPGLPGPQSWRALVDRLRQAGARPAHVHTVVVTHSHPDHFGGAGTLRHRSGADILTHRTFRTWFDPTEDETLDPDDVSDEDRASSPWNQALPWQRDEKFRPPARRVVRMRLWRTVFRRWMRAPTPSRRVDDAEVVRLGRREWVSLHTPGHTPDHLCLYDPAGGIVLSGDHVLPTITPHISGLGAGADPLTAFFASLERVRDLDPVSLVLPAHGHPFTDLAGRARAIREHHEERLEKLRIASAELGPTTVRELSKRLFAPRVWGPMAESETYAHLEHLRQVGRARVLDDDATELRYVVDA